LRTHHDRHKPAERHAQRALPAIRLPRDRRTARLRILDAPLPLLANPLLSPASRRDRVRELRLRTRRAPRRPVTNRFRRQNRVRTTGVRCWHDRTEEPPRSGSALARGLGRSARHVREALERAGRTRTGRAGSAPRRHRARRGQARGRSRARRTRATVTPLSHVYGGTAQGTRCGGSYSAGPLPRTLASGTPGDPPHEPGHTALAPLTNDAPPAVIQPFPPRERRGIVHTHRAGGGNRARTTATRHSVRGRPRRARGHAPNLRRSPMRRKRDVTSGDQARVEAATTGQRAPSRDRRLRVAVRVSVGDGRRDHVPGGPSHPGPKLGLRLASGPISRPQRRGRDSNPR
jgi:hypothetical protein